MTRSAQLLIAMAILLLISGCSRSLMTWADVANERQIQSCSEFQGSGSLGDGVGSGSGAIHIIITTGGVEFAQCVELLD